MDPYITKMPHAVKDYINVFENIKIECHKNISGQKISLIFDDLINEKMALNKNSN